MRNLLLILTILSLAGAAQADTVIGLFADEDMNSCDAALIPYVPTLLYVVAYWDAGPLDDGITAAEFKLDGLPQSDGYPLGTVTVNHTTDLVIGSVWTDYSAAWSEPQGVGAGQFTVCSLELLMFDTIWVGVDQEVVVSPGNDCDCLVLVDAMFDVHDAVGGLFTLNCSAPPCNCFPPVATESTSWSNVKSLF
ncbi:hypothetical protein H8E52_00240 [bacterium]|nr:hypothetical protein [bacterium]